MFNQTECYNNQDKQLNNDSIVAIVVAGCSLIATLGTFAYFKLISKFKDMQQSEIELTTEQNSNNNKTVIKVRFVNDEQFEVSSKSAKNGKDEESGLTTTKAFDTLTSTLPSKQHSSSKINPTSEMTEVMVTNFHDAIDNNNSGDKIIAVTRKGLILNAFNTFLKTVKVYNVDEEHVIDISENRSRSNSDYHDFSRSNSDLKDIPKSHHTMNLTLHDSKASFKVVSSKSCPEIKPAKEKAIIPKLSLDDLTGHSNYALNTEGKISNKPESNFTLTDSVCLDNIENGSKTEKLEDASIDWQTQFSFPMKINNASNDTFEHNVYPEKFKHMASKKRPSLAPLIESSDEDTNSSFVEETKVAGAIFEN